MELKANSRMEKPQELDLSHHKRFEYCTKRLNYRDGRKLTAIKVKVENLAPYNAMILIEFDVFFFSRLIQS